jgi:stalled ribosome rescue protein Dom34
MPFNHAVVWLDHKEAHVLHFSADAAESENLKAHPRFPQVHSRKGESKPEIDRQYFDELAVMLDDASEILVAGPAQEKLVFVKYLEQHHPATAAKVVAVEAADHPTSGELLTHARRYFVKTDTLR